MKTAVIILGHGSKAESAGGPVLSLVAALRSAGRFACVEHAFLQYAPPTLEEAVGKCSGQGAAVVAVVPFFVQTGAHVSRDIPALVEELRKRYPAVTIRLTGHVGGHPLMAEIVKDLVEKNGAED